MELIEKFRDYWVWGEYPLEEEYTVFSGLSNNGALPWSAELIEKYKDKWLWYALSFNSLIPWTLELINKYHNNWDWDVLQYNEAIWERIIIPHLDKEFIIDVLEE